MTTATKMSSDRAHKVMKQVGNEFVKSFMANYSGQAMQLRSREPGVCWKAGGRLSYATVQEYTGPETSSYPTPLIAQIQVNTYPPPALTAYHLTSPHVRHVLGVRPNPVIASDPKLELNCEPDDIPKFGNWLTQWIDAQFRQQPDPPTPPIPLYWWTWEETGRGKFIDYNSLRNNWRKAEFIWTEPAAVQHRAWLEQLN